MKLSILIPFIPEHEHSLKLLVAELNRQSEGVRDQVEVLTLDGVAHKDGGKPTGQKRNELIESAQGEYVTFLDADDTISPEYIERVLRACENGSDVVCYDVLYMNKSGFKKLVKYSMKFDKDSETPDYFKRLPNHLMVFKRELANRVKFKPITFGEDADWAKRIKPLIKSETSISDVLYYYKDMK